MRELRDEDLILYYYGESRHSDEVRRQLDASPETAERYRELCELLEVVESQPVPEPWDDYDERVWRRLQPRLAEQPGGIGGWLSAWWSPRRLASLASVTALVALAFLAGRWWPGTAVDPDSPQVTASLAEGLVTEDLTAAGRERILLVSVGEHLERSEMLLIELVNAPPAGVDLSGELRRAEELLPFNRLYRQAAQRSGQAAVAELLEELERLLLDVAHSGDLSNAGLGELRQRIEDGGILFRVQVVGSRVDHHQDRYPKTQTAPERLGDV